MLTDIDNDDVSGIEGIGHIGIAAGQVGKQRGRGGMLIGKHLHIGAGIRPELLDIGTLPVREPGAEGIGIAENDDILGIGCRRSGFRRSCRKRHRPEGDGCGQDGCGDDG